MKTDEVVATATAKKDVVDATAVVGGGDKSTTDHQGAADDEFSDADEEMMVSAKSDFTKDASAKKQEKEEKDIDTQAGLYIFGKIWPLLVKLLIQIKIF